MSEIKVFAMNPCDWMAAESLESAKFAYLADYAGGCREDDALEDPRELDAGEDKQINVAFADGKGVPPFQIQNVWQETILSEIGFYCARSTYQGGTD